MRRLMACKPLRPRLPIMALLASLWLGALPAWADPLQDCDAPESDRILKAQVQTGSVPARAIWSNDEVLLWSTTGPSGHRPDPSAGGSGAAVRYRLVSSQNAELLVQAGRPVAGADWSAELVLASAQWRRPAAVQWVGEALALQAPAWNDAQWQRLLKSQSFLVQEDHKGQVMAFTGIQWPRAIDARLPSSLLSKDLSPAKNKNDIELKLWAPSAQNVQVCLFPGADTPATAVHPMSASADVRQGLWHTQLATSSETPFVLYLVDVIVPGLGLVRHRVTDPYSLSLNTQSRRTAVLDLSSPDLLPQGWKSMPPARKLRTATDMSIYELHVRDFSVNDEQVPPQHRGKYLAFTHPQSRGMQHLKKLSEAGLTDVHLLPIFDLATVPESACVTPLWPSLSDLPGDSTRPRELVAATQSQDCFNWGYDPLHFNAPEGSYATNAQDPRVRVRELREMVMALHRLQLRVGMDVVYNHTSASGHSPLSVLDRIVPGYYHRLDLNGQVETSTCCANTATEHRMMSKLMSDSVLIWARDYAIDSFRFDLMGHQPRAAMEEMQARLRRELRREVEFIGEGWNFGEVQDNIRFVQASQLSLKGSGIGSFNDRMRDAVRGGGPSDQGSDLFRQGWSNGLFFEPNGQHPATRQDLLRATDWVRAGLAGSLSDFKLSTAAGTVSLDRIDYHGQPAGYTSAPQEAVNYVENHDNQTLWDINLYKLRSGSSPMDRAKVQVLAMASTALAQGVAYFHAGVDILRSKNLDRNSYDSGDWFNRMDWTYQTNHFPSGLPPLADNEKNASVSAHLFQTSHLRSTPESIAFARDSFLDLLRVRHSSQLFRMHEADQIKQRLSFLPTEGPETDGVIAAHLQGKGYAGARFKEILYVLNPRAQTVSLDLSQSLKPGRNWRLHPVHLSAKAADRRMAKVSRADRQGMVTVPDRSWTVFVR